jgi:hypothetical protein
MAAAVFVPTVVEPFSAEVPWNVWLPDHVGLPAQEPVSDSPTDDRVPPFIIGLLSVGDGYVPLIC